MLNQFDPNVKATIAFLKLHNVKVNSSTVNETLQNHPDWPSMLCIADSLNKWNVRNAAGKIEVNQIDELPFPFLAYTNNREYPLAVVTNVHDISIHLYSKNYSKQTTVSKDEFLISWTGIYLIAEPNKESGEKNYSKNKRKAFISSLIPFVLFILMAFISFILIYKIINQNHRLDSFNSASVYFQYFLFLLGVIVTSLLLWYEIDKNNPLLQKVCTGIAKGNCNAILTGKKSKVFNWLSWSEVGFFYFTGGLLVLLSSGKNINYAMSLLGVLNVLALSYIIFSVYYQWFVAKQWCVLCLAVQSLLLFGGINTFANSLFASFYTLSVSFSINAIIIYFLPILFWFTIKPYILNLQESKNTKRQYLRIKFNTEIFETLRKKQKEITRPTNGLGIDIGDPGASNILIKVCNPYCEPCAQVHTILEEIVHRNPNVKVKIIFNSTRNERDFRKAPVKHLLSIAAEGNKLKIEKCLNDWYLTQKKDFSLFKAKYPLNSELLEQDDKIDAMDKWCQRMQITHTPTIFFNGYELPNAYSVEDLKYFLSE